MASSLGLALLLVVIGIFVMAILPWGGIIVGLILIVVAIALVASAVRRGRSAV